MAKKQPCPTCGEIDAPACPACRRRSVLNARTMEWKRKNLATWNGYQRERRYGLKAGERQAMLDAQGGRCAVCNTDQPTSRGWFLDHDHRFPLTDRRGHRGLLCQPCNSLLGLAKDSTERLESAINYLRSHRAKIAA